MRVSKSALIVGGFAVSALLAALGFLIERAGQLQFTPSEKHLSPPQRVQQVVTKDRRSEIARESVVALPRRRLPAGYHWGHCLLVVQGHTRVSGECSYRIYKGGDFYFAGPHQVYGGVDYPQAESQAGEQSTDFWVNVFRDGDDWAGYGNSDVRSTHGDGPTWSLKRQGACFIGDDVKMCLWRN